MLELIASLGIQLVLTSAPDCGHWDSNGCYYYKEKIIYANSTSTVYHELGHALFHDDEVAKSWIKSFEPLRSYTKYVINGYDPYEEMVADYFAYFMLKPVEFSVKYPCLYLYFKDKIN